MVSIQGVSKKRSDGKAVLIAKRQSDTDSLLLFLVVLLLCVLILCSLLVYFPGQKMLFFTNCLDNAALARHDFSLAAKALDAEVCFVLSFLSAGLGRNELRAQRFNYVARKFQYKYDGSGRKPPGSASKISLDFEIEIWTAKIVMTPPLLLVRGHLNPLIGRDLNSSEIFPRVSNWFSVGLDGVLDSTASIMELQTVTTIPSAFLEGPLVSEVQAWMDRVALCHKGQVCPIGRGALGTIQYRSESGVPDAAIQYTVGLPLSRVPKLFELTALVNKRVHSDLIRAEMVCGRKAHGCSNSYRGLLLLAARLISTASRVRDCKMPPKRHIGPWLVRTHFGDLAQFGGVPLDELQHLPKDAVDVANLNPTSLLWRRGLRDYLHFQDVAEISRLVQARDAHENIPEEPMTKPELAIDVAGLEMHASTLLNKSRRVDHRLAVRPCLPSGNLTAEHWLEEVTNGRDLMSDWDSPISASKSRSHLIWKSMGQWRMRLGDDRVFLECNREKVLCLPTNHSMAFQSKDHTSLARAIRGVARVVGDLE